MLLWNRAMERLDWVARRQGVCTCSTKHVLCNCVLWKCYCQYFGKLLFLLFFLWILWLVILLYLLETSCDCVLLMLSVYMCPLIYWFLIYLEYTHFHSTSYTKTKFGWQVIGTLFMDVLANNNVLWFTCSKSLMVIIFWANVMYGY